MDLDDKNMAAAEANFALATKDIRKKDSEQYVYIAKAYMNANTPDYNKAIEILNKAKIANPNDTFALLAFGDAYYGLKNQNDSLNIIILNIDNQLIESFLSYPHFHKYLSKNG